MRVTRGRLVRFVGAVSLACVSVPLTGVGPALADTAALTPSNSAYFFALGIDKPDVSPAAPPNVTTIAADGVSTGNLAVAAQGGTEDKVSFLYFDVFNLPPGATIDKAVVSMKLVPLSPEDVSYNETPESVQACMAGDSGFAGDDGVGLANAPERKCTQFSAKGTAGAAGTYQWDVTSLAQTWLTGENDGLAFTRADESPGSNFQVVFGPAGTARLDLTYTPAAPVVEPGPVVAPPPVDPGSVVAPPVTGFEPSEPVDLGGVTDPGTVPAPTVTQPPALAGPQVAAKPVALSTSLRPANAFWIAGLGLVVALVLVSLVLGDVSSSPAARRRSRLALALADPHRLASVQSMRHRSV